MIRSKKHLHSPQSSFQRTINASPKRDKSMDSEKQKKVNLEDLSKSKYTSLYTKTRVGTLESIDLSVNPTIDGERENHNKQSRLSMWTMEENIDKLKQHGEKFENAGVFKTKNRTGKESKAFSLKGLTTASTSSIQHYDTKS